MKFINTGTKYTSLDTRLGTFAVRFRPEVIRIGCRNKTLLEWLQEPIDNWLIYLLPAAAGACDCRYCMIQDYLTNPQGSCTMKLIATAKRVFLQIKLDLIKLCRKRKLKLPLEVIAWEKEHTPSKSSAKGSRSKSKRKLATSQKTPGTKTRTLSSRSPSKSAGRSSR